MRLSPAQRHICDHLNTGGWLAPAHGRRDPYLDHTDLKLYSRAGEFVRVVTRRTVDILSERGFVERKSRRLWIGTAKPRNYEQILRRLESIHRELKGIALALRSKSPQRTKRKREGQ